MQRISCIKNCIALRLYNKIISAYHGKPDLEKKVLYGGDINDLDYIEKRSFGRLIYDRLKDPSRADKIIQVCATTGQSMTTLTFLKQSVGLAEGLRAKNVRKGDFVLVVGNNSLNMNIALTGIFISGAVAVPISYFANPDDLRHLLTFIQPKFYICDGQTLFTIRRIVSSVLGKLDEKRLILLNDCKYLDTDLQCFPDFINGKTEKWKSFKPAEIHNPKEELAIVMKSLAEGAANRGVALTHSNVLAVISRLEATKSHLLPQQTILMVQKIIWMSGIYSLVSACVFGSKVVVMSEFDEEGFMKAVETHKVTSCFLYPAKIWQLYKYTYPQKYDLSSLTDLYAVGTGIPQTLISLMKEKTGISIKTAYGITEMTGMIIEWNENTKGGSMGKLVPMCFAKVVSKTNQRYGPNMPGELCFKGPTLMKGYINDLKATRDLIDKDGFLHTGDYGYYNEEGYFFILDKVKEVIKYREKEVSPLEIEGQLKSLDAIKDCVVSGISHAEDGYRAVAFVVLQPGKTITAEEITKFIESKLPEHKQLKGGVIFIPKVPRSRESGFIKRSAINKILAKYRLVGEPGEQKKADKDEMEKDGMNLGPGHSEAGQPQIVPRTKK